VLGRFKRYQGIIQALALPIRLRGTPTVAVTGDAVNKFMVPNILCRLVGISAARAGSPYQRQSEFNDTR
jgi:hypothetical protein